MSREFTPAEAMEFFQKMWNPLGLPLPGMPAAPGGGTQGGTQGAGKGAAQGAGQPAEPLPMPPFFPFLPQMGNAAMNPFATFDPAEVEKKIVEFKAIEAWLNMQLGMLQMTIKTMEMQKASLEALKAQASGSGSPGGKGRT